MELEHKKEKYINLYSQIVGLFNPRQPKEREMIVMARAVIYRLETLKGDVLKAYIDHLENGIKNKFLNNCI